MEVVIGERYIPVGNRRKGLYLGAIERLYTGLYMFLILAVESTQKIALAYDSFLVIFSELCIFRLHIGNYSFLDQGDLRCICSVSTAAAFIVSKS